MKSRHTVDTKTAFSGEDYLSQPSEKEIEALAYGAIPSSDPQNETVNREPYLPSDAATDVVNLAIALRRPLLIQGEPGCGKSRLAFAVAYQLGIPIEEFFVKSTSQAQDLLYTYDAVSRLHDAQLGENGTRQNGKLKYEDARNYVRLGPLGSAISRSKQGRASVVLIDEIDKADIDFPNDLLHELDRLEFRVNEAPEMRFSAPPDNVRAWPIVFVTHNGDRSLPAAFLRRCIFYKIEFPSSEDQLERILTVHRSGLSEKEGLAKEAINFINKARQLDLDKAPSLSELIDWVSYADATDVPIADLSKHGGAILKNEDDMARVQEALLNEQDPE